MEFPRHLHKPGGLYVVCPDEANFEALQPFGWALLPEAHVEQPVEVRLYDALRGEPKADTAPSAPAKVKNADAMPSVADLSVEDAKAVIAQADAVELAAIEAEEHAGKARKGILALIEVRKADLLDD